MTLAYLANQGYYSNLNSFSSSSAYRSSPPSPLSFSFPFPSERKKQIHPEHSARFNHDMQLQIDCIEWALEKIEVNKIPNDRLDGHIRSMIKNLEKRKDKAMIRSDTDDLWTKIETLQWVLYVIFAIKNERMVVI
jgi:hypothetical protein